MARQRIFLIEWDENRRQPALPPRMLELPGEPIDVMAQAAIPALMSDERIDISRVIAEDLAREALRAALASLVEGQT
jgi:hypothetical protein